MDGTTFSVAVPEETRVAEMKRAIGALREVPHYAMELFVEGEEEPLDDEKRLMSAEKVPLFMLPKEASDRLALGAIFRSCGGANWLRKRGWMTDADLGDWEGVTVGAEGRVTELELGRNNLAGPLPSELGQLSALQVLHLDKNNLTAPIPADLGQLGALTYLNLANNQLSGFIPAELQRLGALKTIYVQNNQLSGQEALRLHLREHNPRCRFSGSNLGVCNPRNLMC
jgi:Leucine-rich repeat (LRR) protein